MPSMRDVIMSVEVGRGRGLGFLLRQCLSGGVFRWLMLACGEDIDKIIQVRTSFCLHSMMYRFCVVNLFTLAIRECKTEDEIALSDC